METRQQLIDHLNTELKEALVFCYPVRNSGLQQDACRQLENVLAGIYAAKEAAIGEKDEDWANFLLGWECYATGVKSYIEMWLLIKQDLPDAAWDRLVDAQSALEGAMNANERFAHLAGLLDTMVVIEKTVFPKQVFNSVGMIVHKQVCSICEQDYEDCDHIKGRPYMGRFCNVRLKECEIDHISFVDEPANRRCRITHFSEDGGMRNRMTWLIEPKREEQQLIETDVVNVHP